MDIFKIAGIGVISAMLAVLLKNRTPESAMQVVIISSVVIFSLIASQLSTIIRTFENLTLRANIDVSYIQTVLKVIGIAYIAQFGSEICKDAGQSAIASKIELGGRVLIVTMILPMIASILNLLVGLIN